MPTRVLGLGFRDVCRFPKTLLVQGLFKRLWLVVSFLSTDGMSSARSITSNPEVLPLEGVGCRV